MSEWIGRPHILTSGRKKKTFKVFTFGGALLAVFISLEENKYFFCDLKLQFNFASVENSALSPQRLY